MLVLGIDVGINGALAFFDPDRGLLDLVDMPKLQIERNGKTKSTISAPMLAALIRARSETLIGALVEQVGAMPGQGVSSMFSFGRSLGIVEGTLAGLHIPVFFSTPQSWQKVARVAGGKDGSRARASELYPAYAAAFSRKKDDGRADAALIAWVGATTVFERPCASLSRSSLDLADPQKRGSAPFKDAE